MVTTNTVLEPDIESESDDNRTSRESIQFSIGDGGSDSRVRSTYEPRGSDTGGRTEPTGTGRKRGRRSRAEIEQAIRDGTYTPPSVSPTSRISKESVAKDLAQSAVACLDVVCSLLSRVRGQHWLLSDEEKKALTDAGSRAFRHLNLPTGELSKTADYLLAGMTVSVVVGSRVITDVAIARAQRNAYARTVNAQNRGETAGPNYQTPNPDGDNDFATGTPLYVRENEVGENHNNHVDFEFSNGV